MEANMEMNDLETGAELQHDLGDFPDGFDPDLYQI